MGFGKDGLLSALELRNSAWWAKRRRFELRHSWRGSSSRRLYALKLRDIDW